MAPNACFTMKLPCPCFLLKVKLFNYIYMNLSHSKSNHKSKTSNLAKTL